MDLITARCDVNLKMFLASKGNSISVLCRGFQWLPSFVPRTAISAFPVVERCIQSFWREVRGGTSYKKFLPDFSLFECESESGDFYEFNIEGEVFPGKWMIGVQGDVRVGYSCYHDWEELTVRPAYFQLFAYVRVEVLR